MTPILKTEKRYRFINMAEHQVRLSEKYMLGEKLGAGGTSEVFRATHKRTQSKVVIKCMSRRRVSAYDIQQEVTALVELEHSNIVKLYEIIDQQYCEYVYLVMEYLQGHDLWNYIKNNRVTIMREELGLPERDVRIIFSQIVKTVSYMHEAGYAHRDIKGGNVMVADNMKATLIDFGFTLTQTRYEERYDERWDGNMNGTPEFMSPELLTGLQIDLRMSDMWSLGVLLYHMLTSTYPFDNNRGNLLELKQLIQRGVYTKPHHLSPQASAILDRLLQVNPDERATCRELMNHPWLCIDTSEIYSPTEPIDREKLDKKCTREMGYMYGIQWMQMIERVRAWRYDQFTATYLLLLEKRMKKKEKRPTKKISCFSFLRS